MEAVAGYSTGDRAMKKSLTRADAASIMTAVRRGEERARLNAETDSILRQRYWSNSLADRPPKPGARVYSPDGVAIVTRSTS
jgi:hypothetical protein